jgi:hypothetical protein
VEWLAPGPHGPVLQSICSEREGDVADHIGVLHVLSLLDGLRSLCIRVSHVTRDGHEVDIVSRAGAGDGSTEPGDG